MPKPVVLLASAAFAFFHGGLWAYESLREPRCAPCRLRTGLLFGSAALAVLAAAGLAGAYWVRLALGR